MTRILRVGADRMGSGCSPLSCWRWAVPGAVYFLEDGTVTAQLESLDEEPQRLNTMSSENLVGELGFYLGSKRRDFN